MTTPQNTLDRIIAAIARPDQAQELIRQFPKAGGALLRPADPDKERRASRRQSRTKNLSGRGID